MKILNMRGGYVAPPPDEGPRMTRPGYLKKDRMERYNSKRGWFVNAWRIVDAQGKDMVQPWSNTKSEARRVAAQLGIELVGELP